MPSSVKVNPVTGAAISKKQLKKQLTVNNYGVKPTKAQVKAEWHMQGILAVPKFQKLKPVLATALNVRSKRSESSVQSEINRDEFLAHIRDRGSDFDEQNPYEYNVTHPDGSVDHYRWNVSYEVPHKSFLQRLNPLNWVNQFNPYSGTQDHVPRQVSHYNVTHEDRPGITKRPNAPSSLPVNTEPVAAPRANPVVVSGPVPAVGYVQPVYRSPAYVPQAVTRTTVPSTSGNSASFSYAPFRGFNQSSKSTGKRRATSSLRYSDLYPNERECVRTKLGGWAKFKLLPYSQQISSLRACLRASRY